MPPMQRYLTSRNPSMPYFEPSRPMPLSFMPPKGAISVEMMPVWCLAIRLDNRGEDGSLNTEGSERKVPLHPAIIAEGFLDYVRSLPKNGPLFYRRSRFSTYLKTICFIAPGPCRFGFYRLDRQQKELVVDLARTVNAKAMHSEEVYRAYHEEPYA